MKIAIMCSLDFPEEVLKIKLLLEEAGHEVSLPFTLARIINGELNAEEIKSKKVAGELYKTTAKLDLIRKNWERLKAGDAVLIINLTKKGVENHIGGNTFLEIGFAHVENKKTYLWNDIPNMPYSDEIRAMAPIVINHDISKIR